MKNCAWQELVEGFDQETAAVVMARYASLKMEIEVISSCRVAAYHFRCL